MLSCLLIPVELQQFNQVKELTSLFTKYLQISFCATFYLQISVPDVIMKKCNCIRDHSDKPFCPTALCCSVSLCSMRIMGLPGGKRGMIWDSQTLLWVSDATVVCVNAAKPCFDWSLKIKASLLLFQLLMDWNNMNEHEVPSSLLTLHPLGARQELRCVTCYCINNAVLLLMFNIPQYEGRKVGQM